MADLQAQPEFQADQLQYPASSNRFAHAAAARPLRMQKLHSETRVFELGQIGMLLVGVSLLAQLALLNATDMLPCSG